MQQMFMDIFRVAAIFIAILFAFFCYRIYILTKGGSKGWLYIAISCMLLSVWSVIVVIFSRVFDVEIIRLWATVLIMIPISFLGPLGLLKLLNDLKVKVWLLANKRNFILYNVTVWVVMLAYNFMTPMISVSNELASMAHFMIPATFFPMTYTSWKLADATKQKAWKLLLGFVFFIALGVLLGTYLGSCCGEGGDLTGQPTCASYGADYTNIYPVLCITGLVQFSMLYNAIEIVGLVFGLAAFYLLWKAVSLR